MSFLDSQLIVILRLTELVHVLPYATQLESPLFISLYFIDNRMAEQKYWSEENPPTSILC